MSSYAALELIGEHRKLIFDTWNFFVGIHLSLIGLIFVSRRHITFVERFVAIAGYAGFAWMNYTAQVGNYAYLTELISKSVDPAAEFGSATGIAIDVAGFFDIAWIQGALPYIYGTAATFAILILLFVNL
ncbi:MAG: hypothetical protein AAGL49_10650, partial [Pseudomonadota bacterium]